MKKLMWWGVLGLATAAIALVGCGSNSDSGNVSVRVANATLTHPSIDLYINGTVALTGAQTDTVSNYASPGAGANTLQVNDTTSGAGLSVSAPNLAGNNHYTLVAYESNGTVKTVVVTEDLAAPVSGTGLLRFYNAAADAGKLDIYVTAPTADLATQSPTASFTSGVVPAATLGITEAVGTYRVRVTAAGSKTDVRLDMPSVTLANQQIGNIVFTPTSGGALLNGSFLLEQSTYTAVRNPNTRVRLAAAVSGNTSVSASATAPATAASGAVVCTGAANSCVIDAGSVAPAFGFYTQVPAGSTLSVTAGGSVAAPATPLAPGADMTLLVYGAPGAAVASLLTDDNHLPTDATTVKLSLINAVTGTPGALTLTANSSLVASNVAPGTQSASTPVPASTNPMNLRVTSSTTAGVFLSDTSNTLNAGGVYTVMISGPSTAPQLFLH